MAPLPEHEYSKKIIGTLVETLLDELGINFWPLGSVSIKKRSMGEGVEPDECYYITNEAVVRGRDRLDFEIDPPPDLAIEIDITSRTRFDNYEILGVSELWRYNGQDLEINVLEEGKYRRTLYTNIFPRIIDVKRLIPELLAVSKIAGRSEAIKKLKAIIA
jgi:Uma2 family endonuclease